MWLILLNLKGQPRDQPAPAAEAVGIREATLTHHLNLLDAQGLVSRRRDPANRRVHVVELTPEGEALFQRLVGTPLAFDRQIRRGISDTEASRLAGVLDRLAGNVAGKAAGASG